MLRLSFSQKVGLGFAVILVLLTASGLNSLWILNDISRSNTQVQENAVPVVRVANQVQIQLLKLANVSALSYNALTEEEIRPYRTEFDKDAVLFGEALKKLDELARQDQALHASVEAIAKSYDEYKTSVTAMLDAKLAMLVARGKVDAETETLITMSDDLGGSYMDIVDYIAPPGLEKEMKIISGHANQADSYMVSLTKTIRETQTGSDITALDNVVYDLNAIVAETTRSLDMADQAFSEFDDDGLIKNSRDFLAALESRINAQPGLVEFKREELTHALAAKDSFDASKKSVAIAVEGLDKVLADTDSRFLDLQRELVDNLSFGFKSTIAITLLLLILASQNFNSMRLAIRKKMIDLSKLNSIGSTLAAARDQATALDAVLHAMSDKMGVEHGSVYLFNKQHELEAKAFLPPIQMEESHRAITFTMGEGIIGRAAEAKKALFVPDTSKDSTYVGREGDKPRALLCVPLLDKDIVIGVMNFSGGIDTVSFADSDYEFVSSVAVSLVTTIKNIRMVEVIEEHNRDLEKKVEERTSALKQKNDDIANMLSNMHQGLFTIIEGGLVHPEYAAYLETIFETPNIANRNFSDLLFSHASISHDVLDSAITAVAAIVGEDTMMYEFNSHLLVREVTLQFQDNRHKLIELDWDPIVDENDVVTKLMVTVRDVTELKALQAEAEGQKQELAIIGEILSVDGNKFDEFIRGSYNFAERCRTIISETGEKDPGRLAELFRNMHTVKGNARTYGFKSITETVHKVENTYDQLRKNDELEWQPDALLNELAEAESVIRRYEEIFREKLLRHEAGRAVSGQVDHEQLAAVLGNVVALADLELPAKARHLVKDTFQRLVSIESKPLSAVIGDVVTSVKSLAQELGKAEPVVQIEDADVYLHSEVHSMLGNIFMHVMRNAVDHGIESIAERIEHKKPQYGTISITANTKEKDGMVTFAVKDDGRGIALGKIFRAAMEKGIYPLDAPRPPAEVIANLIFASGFSTASEVTEVSGRGVGMDAVKQFLLSEGGSIDVVLDAGDEHADYRSFTTYLRLPSKFYTELPSFAKAG